MSSRNLASLGLLAVVVSGAGGCTVWQTAYEVCVRQPKMYCEKRDKKVSMATYRALADQVWAESGFVCPDDLHGTDFAWGFREGFAEYVYAGGTGEPPATPPRVYWQADYRTEFGAVAVKSWFEGYRRGVEAARLGGYRDAVTLRLSASLLDCDECGCPERAKTGACNCCPYPIAKPLDAADIAPALQSPGEVVEIEAEPLGPTPATEEAEPDQFETPPLEQLPDSIEQPELLPALPDIEAANQPSLDDIPLPLASNAKPNEFTEPVKAVEPVNLTRPARSRILSSLRR